MSRDLRIWPTTPDNPFDPFTQMDRWMAWDRQMGYDTCRKLAKHCNMSNMLTDTEYDVILNMGIQSFMDLPESVGYELAVEGQTQRW